MGNGAMSFSTLIMLVVIALSSFACTSGPTPSAPASFPPTFAAANTAEPLSPTATSTVVPSATVLASPTPTRALTPLPPTVTPVPLAPIILKSGSRYFEIGGTPTFLLSRNPTGKTQSDFDALLEWTRRGNSRLIRLHLTHGWWGDPWITSTGNINEAWAKNWERFFDQARASGIYIIPVFGVWADWNDGSPDLGSPLWQYNPLNPANGGPVRSPRELFQAGSVTQNIWLQWVKSLVTRWRARDNIAAWEIFSEVNIASGGTEQPREGVGVDVEAGIELTNRAAMAIRAADPSGRPLTASVAEMYAQTDPWAEFYDISALDFIQVHSYSEQLDRMLISMVRRNLDRYNKPVLIGESGLYAYPHVRTENAHRGIEHAIWAGTVSGAMNGRALWDEDGYSIYSRDRNDAFQFMEQYAAAELPAARFVQGVDFARYKPLPAEFSGAITGATVGTESSAIGWFRDATCEPPNWNIQPLISKETVALAVPGQAANWRVDFYDTKSGMPLNKTITVARQGERVPVPLPDFSDDIAFKMVAVPAGQ